jgi:RHS repeat-associated protein
VNGAVSKAYQYAPTGERLDQITHNSDGTETPTYYTYNPHTDVQAITDSTGNTKSTYGYTAYGADDTTGDTGVDKGTGNGSTSATTTEPYNTYRFNADCIDPATGNYNMGFRNYAPSLNRFLTRDMYDGAFADQNMTSDPYTGNRYAFGSGNPISNIELDGHRPIDDSNDGDTGTTATACTPGTPGCAGPVAAFPPPAAPPSSSVLKSAYEKPLCEKSPLECIEYLTDGAWADTASSLKYGFDENPQRNADRHCLFSAILVHRMGPDTAWKWLDAHEGPASTWGDPNDPHSGYRDHWVDTTNNQVGEAVAYSLSNWDIAIYGLESSISTECDTMMSNGALVTSVRGPVGITVVP